MRRCRLSASGSEEEVRAVGQQYRAYWRTVALEGGDYTIGHTAAIYLMDGETMEGRLEKLRRLIAAGAAREKRGRA